MRRLTIGSIKDIDLEAFPSDELWTLHEALARLLTARIAAEKQELENRLAALGHGRSAEEDATGPSVLQAQGKRPYPRVLPKYQNPLKPTETWSGRGKQPRWLVAGLQSGRQMSDYKINNGQA